MENHEVEKQNNDLDRLFPKELEPFKKGVKPAIKVGEVAGNILSDVIDHVVDSFIPKK